MTTTTQQVINNGVSYYLKKLAFADNLTDYDKLEAGYAVEFLFVVNQIPTGETLQEKFAHMCVDMSYTLSTEDNFMSPEDIANAPFSFDINSAMKRKREYNSSNIVTSLHSITI
jgi:hypothetical protein